MRVVLFDYVFASQRPGASGLSDVVWSLARELVQAGDHVHLVAPYPRQVNAPPGTRVHAFALPPIGYRNAAGHVLIALRGWQFIRRLPGIDLIHAPEYLSTAIFSLLGATPVVLTTPGNIYERITNGSPFDPWFTQVLKIAATTSARRCAAIIAISADQRRWWIRTGAPPDRVTILPYGIDTSLFHPPPPGNDTNRKQPRLLYVGRLSPEKGVDTLLRALAILRAIYPAARLHVVGDGTQRDELRKLASALDVDAAVTWHGWQRLEMLPHFYRAADVLVMPSYSEPLGRVVLEAMACGCPVVGACVGGIADHVIEGRTGTLFSAGNAQELAARLCERLAQPVETHYMALTALAYIRAELAWPAVVQRMRADVYAPVIEWHAPGSQRRRTNDSVNTRGCAHRLS